MVAVLAGLLVLAGCRPAQEEGQGSASGTQGTDRRDQLLVAAAYIALPPSGITAADLPDPQSQGAQLVGTYCAQCHNLPAPGMHSATDWPSVVRRMWLRMEGLPASLEVKVPTMAERFAMLEYLNANALKVSGANLPAGRGREEFSRVCSQCHALPDPRVHSPEDWPTVFARMERNMERMKVPALKDGQTADILLYLRTVASRR
jgi:mono/diheme cytochrome c family protein